MKVPWFFPRKGTMHLPVDGSGEQAVVRFGKFHVRFPR